MKIEDEIKQEKFKTEYQKLLVNILFTGHWIDRINSRLLRPFGISSQQLNVMRILRGQNGKPASIKLIQERMLDKMSNASRLVDKLMEKNLVRRTQSEEDRRQVNVLISNEGKNLLAKIDKVLEKYDEQFKHLSNDEAQQLNDLLDRLRG